jgi:hypothetical protein
LKPALRELVRLLAEKAVEQHIDEAEAEIEQQSPGRGVDDTCSRPNEATSAQAGQSIQEEQSYG